MLSSDIYLIQLHQFRFYTVISWKAFENQSSYLNQVIKKTQFPQENLAFE